MKCPFCLYELKPGERICPKCKIEASSYSYFVEQAAELIDESRVNYDVRSTAIELLRHSLALDNTKPLSLKLLGLLYTSLGKYDFALHYLRKYNEKIKGDPSCIKLSGLIQSWEERLDRYLEVTF